MTTLQLGLFPLEHIPPAGSTVYETVTCVYCVPLLAGVWSAGADTFVIVPPLITNSRGVGFAGFRYPGFTPDASGIIALGVLIGGVRLGKVHGEIPEHNSAGVSHDAACQFHVVRKSYAWYVPFHRLSYWNVTV